MSIELQRAHASAKHAAHERAVPFEQLANVFAAATAGNERVPAIRRLAAAGLEATRRAG